MQHPFFSKHDTLAAVDALLEKADWKNEGPTTWTAFHGNPNHDPQNTGGFWTNHTLTYISFKPHGFERPMSGSQAWWVCYTVNMEICYRPGFTEIWRKDLFSVAAGPLGPLPESPGLVVSLTRIQKERMLRRNWAAFEELKLGPTSS